MKSKSNILILLSFALLIFSAGSAYAEVIANKNLYSGATKAAAGTQSGTFRIWDSSINGNLLWCETGNVQVTQMTYQGNNNKDYYYTHVLGSENSLETSWCQNASSSPCCDVSGATYLSSPPSYQLGTYYLEAIISTDVRPRELLAVSPQTGPSWKGAWDSQASYFANDVVTYDGSSYAAVAPSTYVTPGTDSSKWALLAQKGDVGADGFTGPPGVAGPNDLSAATTVTGLSGVLRVSGGQAAGSATTAHVPDSTDKRYVTEFEKAKLANTSNTNTGDETQATIKSKLGAAASGVDGYLSGANWNLFSAAAGSVTSLDNAYTDNLSTGLVSGGGLSSAGTTVNIAAGAGYVINHGTGVRTKVTWGALPGVATATGNGTSYLAIDSTGNAHAFVSKPATDQYIYLGHVYASAGYGGAVIEVFNVPEWAGDFQNRITSLARDGVGTLISWGNSVSEQASPNYLKLVIGGGPILARLGSYDTIETTAFTRMFHAGTSDWMPNGAMPPNNADNTADTT